MVPRLARPRRQRHQREQTIDLSGTTREDGDAERRTDPVCPASEDPVGPTALLRADGEGASYTLDGRRSYSGWDDHRVASWSLDPGDGTTPTTGTDLLTAVLDHGYDQPGTYEAVLTVTYDTGRQATATATVEIAGAVEGQDDGAAEDDATTGPGLAATGGGTAGLGLVGLVVVAPMLPRRGRRDG